MEISKFGKLGFSYKYLSERPSSDLISLLNNFSTPNLSDAMLKFRTMSNGIIPMYETKKIIGPAITVRLRPGDNLMLHKSIDIAQEGDIIVVDTGGCTFPAVWGELMTRAAMAKGIKGVVIDGASRDFHENRELGFPIYSKAIVPCACDKDGPGEINEIISCGGVPVRPGDIIVCDINGVVVIPPERLEEIISNANIKISYENKRISEINNGNIMSGDIDTIILNKTTK